jgi:hypothetical protein
MPVPPGVMGVEQIMGGMASRLFKEFLIEFLDGLVMV